MAKRRFPGWAWIFLAPLALLCVFLPGLWVFMSLTAPVLHPDPQTIPAVAGATAPAALEAVERARQIVRAALREQNIPGMSAAVGLGGEIVWAEGFGYADLRNSEPITPLHRFNIGTASAVLTSAGAGVLIEDGRLKLGEEIQVHVPAFPKKQWPVTLGDVMGHTAGLVSDGGDESALYTKHCERPVEALSYFADSELLFEPGTRFEVSNFGWILVSAAIEQAAGQPFLTYMRERVFDPLGMRDTIADTSTVEGDDDFPLFNLFREKVVDPRAVKSGSGGNSPNPPEDRGKDRVTPYFPRYSADPHYGFHLMRPLDYSCYAGASVFVSTPSDLVRFGMAMNAGKVVKPETARLLQTPQRLHSGADTGYGLGWEIENAMLAGAPARSVGHKGRLLGGPAVSLVTFPDYVIVVALVSNTAYADTYSPAVKIAEAFVH